VSTEPRIQTHGEAPPDLPPELRSLVAAMARVGSCLSPSFSPDGERVAFVSDLSGTPQVWTVPAAGGWPEAVTALDDPVRSVEWSPTGEWLACAVAPGGGMNTQVYLVRPDGTGLRRLTAGGRDNNELGPWARDGRSLAIASNQGSAESMDAYVYDLDAGELRLVARNRGIGRLTDLGADGRRAALYRMASRGDDNLYLLLLDGGEEALLTPHEGPGSFEEGALSPDGRTVYLSSNAGRDLVAFARVALGEDGAPGPIEVIAERGDAELYDFELSPDGGTAAVLWNVAGRSELALLDLATLESSPGPELPSEVAWEVRFSPDGRRLALSLTGSAAPADIHLLDVESGDLSQLTRSPHAGVDLGALIRPELVRFEAHDGLPLSGWLYLPAGFDAPGPMVLSFHGGPEGQEVPYFDPTYQALLAAGVAVFAPNVRGSSGFGKRFVNLDNGALRFDAVRDLETCARYVVERGVGAPGRLGVMGGSYGGYMTMAGLTRYPELFAAGVNLYGIVNFETFFEQTEPWMAAISKMEYGDPETEVELLRELSPLHSIERVSAPTLVLHGANDTNVPVVEAEQVVERLRARGVPVRYVLFPDEGHGFRKAPNRVRATEEIVRWFRGRLHEAAPGP
jgi:dipeptidyl aminopeptidase/acylaminoacyl peptidase